jgi:hypothetical protein
VSVVDEITKAPTEATTPTPETAKPRRGWVSLYAVAFGLMLGAGVALAASSLGSLRSIGLLWLSAALSGAAIVVAVVSILGPRHR